MLIPDEIRKAVGFVCYNTDDGVSLYGTAFFVGLPIEGTSELDLYVVTARHVIEGINQKSTDQTAYIRVNYHDGQGKATPLPTTEWFFHPLDDSVDIAVAPWPMRVDMDIRFLPPSLFFDKTVEIRSEVGIGDDVFLTGLFLGHHGTQRNLPIVRIGNIAAMPEELIETNWGTIEGYLIEARSIGGLSGSPVFVHLGNIRKMKGSTLLLAGSPQFYLLGVMHGHWDQPICQLDAPEDDLGSEKVNMGIAIVVPVAKLLEILNQPSLLDYRRELGARLRQPPSSQLDVQPPPPTDLIDVNPF